MKRPRVTRLVWFTIVASYHTASLTGRISSQTARRNCRSPADKKEKNTKKKWKWNKKNRGRGRAHTQIKNQINKLDSRQSPRLSCWGFGFSFFRYDLFLFLSFFLGPRSSRNSSSSSFSLVNYSPVDEGARNRNCHPSSWQSTKHARQKPIELWQFKAFHICQRWRDVSFQNVKSRVFSSKCQEFDTV
jgi:hypothetical protein